MVRCSKEIGAAPALEVASEIAPTPSPTLSSAHALPNGTPKGASPSIGYCQYLGSIVNKFYRAARMPKLVLQITETESQSDYSGNCILGKARPCPSSSMQRVFTNRWTNIMAFMFCTSSITNAFQDNWGAPVHKVEHYEKTIQQVTSACKFDFRPMSSVLDAATVNFYPSTEDWASYKGTDLVPENNHLYLRSGNFPKGRGFPSNDEKSILAAECEIENSDGSTWSIQRIGPFKSTGNYDWWQFAWDDVLQFKEKLKSAPDGLHVLNHFSGPVDAEGEVLSFPPIHIHHVHISPGEKNQYRVANAKCLYDIEMCSHPFHTMAEQHGDYVCLPEEGGTNCYLEDLPFGYGKMVLTPMTINGELNDVRAPNSPEIEWYYQFAARWVPVNSPPGKELAPLSFHYMWSPGRLDLNDQSTMVNTFLAPTGYDSFIWYTGYMFGTGKLIRGKMHTHNTVFDESFLFSGTPEQLGLGSPKFRPKSNAYDVVPTSQTGFKNNKELMEYVLDQFNDAVQSDDPNKPRLVCHGKTSNLRVDGYDYDRRAPTHCDEWHFRKGEQFTVIGFNKHSGVPPGPHMPDRVPEWLPGHLHWFIMSELEGSTESKYTYGFYSQDPGLTFGHTKSYIPMGGMVNAVVFQTNKGMPTESQFWNTICMFTFVAGTIFLSVSAGLRYAISKAKKCA